MTTVRLLDGTTVRFANHLDAVRWVWTLDLHTKANAVLTTENG